MKLFIHIDESFPGKVRKEFFLYDKKISWPTRKREDGLKYLYCALYKHILSKRCSELGFFGRYFQDMRVFPHCKCSAVSEIAVRPQSEGWPGGSGRGWTQMCPPHPLPTVGQLGKSHFPCTEDVPSHLSVFFTRQFPTALFFISSGFWPCQVQKCVFHRNSCRLKSSFSSLECEEKLLWLRAELSAKQSVTVFLGEKVFLVVRKGSLRAPKAAFQPLPSTTAALLGNSCLCHQQHHHIPVGPS